MQMQRWSQTIARLCLVAWMGAAIFFVAVAIRPIRSPELDTISKALLASLLFPGYYSFGFTLLGVGWVSTLLSKSGRFSWQLGWVTLAIVISISDWLWIYTPLAEMTRRQWMEQAAPAAEFRSYHIASMCVNSASLICAIVAAVLSCLPEQASASIQTSDASRPSV